MKQKKSWLYYGTLAATILTLIGIWSHLATAFSIYEVKSDDFKPFDWSFSGMVIASAISLFLILDAIGITKLEKRAETAKGKANKMIMTNHKSLNRFLIFFAVIEMYGNVYYSIAAHLHNPVFKFDDMLGIDPVAAVSIFMFSFTLTIISIVGSKLLSIFAVNDEDEVGKTFMVASTPKSPKGKDFDDIIADEKYGDPEAVETMRFAEEPMRSEEALKPTNPQPTGPVFDEEEGSGQKHSKPGSTFHS